VTLGEIEALARYFGGSGQENPVKKAVKGTITKVIQLRDLE